MPKDKPLADIIEETLHVSRDGAYRRMGGRTALTLNEAMTLTQAHKLNFADFLGAAPGRILFDQVSSGLRGLPSLYPSYIDFLEKTAPLEITFASNVILRSNLFDFPDLAFFHSFYMAKSVVGEPALLDAMFALDMPMRAHLLTHIEPVAARWFQIPAVEILHNDAINSLIHPVLYYWETGIFDDMDTPLHLLGQIQQVINHWETKVTVGKNLRVGEPRDADRPKYQLYSTEMPMMDSTGLFKLKDGLMVLHTLSGLNMVTTTNPTYSQNIESLFRTLMEKSLNINAGGEKQRIQHFNAMRRRVDAALRKIVEANGG